LDPRRPASGIVVQLDIIEEALPRLRYPVMNTDMYPCRSDADGFTGVFWARGTEFSKLLDQVNQLRGNVPHWLCLQSFVIPNSTYRWPTPAELRCQVYRALVHDVKGFEFFLYTTVQYQSSSAVDIEGLVDADLRPTSPVYDEVKKILAEIKKLGPVLLDIKPVAGLATVNAPHEIQTFADAHGVRYLLVVNNDCLADALST
jgi:hypothetical protein